MSPPKAVACFQVRWSDLTTVWWRGGVLGLGRTSASAVHRHGSGSVFAPRRRLYSRLRRRGPTDGDTEVRFDINEAHANRIATYRRDRLGHTWARRRPSQRPSVSAVGDADEREPTSIPRGSFSTASDPRRLTFRGLVPLEECVRSRTRMCGVASSVPAPAPRTLTASRPRQAATPYPTSMVSTPERSPTGR